jgi:hypothetical protein
MSFRLVSSPGECALAPRRPGSPGHLSPRWERAAINHIGKNGQQAKLFCRAPRCRCLLLRSKRVPHASALGERISGYRKVSRASAASNSQPLRALVMRSFLRVGLTPPLSAIFNRSAVKSSYQVNARRPRSPDRSGKSDKQPCRREQFERRPAEMKK